MNQPSYDQGLRNRSKGARRKHPIPREFDSLLSQLTQDPQEQLELWWHALVLLMLERDQVVMIGQHELAGRTWVTLRMEGENEFEIVRPNLTDDMESILRDGVREIMTMSRRRRHGN